MLDLVGLRQLAGIPGQRHLTDVQHVGQVGDGEGHGGVLLHQQHRGALPVDLGDDLADLPDDPRRQTEGRLVEQQQLRAGHQRPADGQHLLLAAGQQDAALGVPLGEHREHLVHPGLRLGLGLPVPAAHATGPQVLLHRQPAEDAPALGHLHHAHPDGLRRVPADQVGVPEAHRSGLDLAAVQLEGARDGPQQRALAGPVAAQHGDHLAVGDLQGDTPHRLHGTAVGDVQRVDAQHGQDRLTVGTAAGTQDGPSRSGPSPTPDGVATAVVQPRSVASDVTHMGRDCSHARVQLCETCSDPQPSRYRRPMC